MGLDRRSFLKTAGLGIGALTTGLPSLAWAPSTNQLKPKKLPEGGTIGLISPASSLPEMQEYDEILEKIEKLGFKTKVGVHAKDHFGYLAGTDENRAADLNAMFADSSVDAIVPFRGGWGCNRILEFIDFDIIRKNPKPLIGFSDITSLLLAIYAKTGLIAYHGPVGSSDWSRFTWYYFKQAVMQSAPYTMSNNRAGRPSRDITTITSGTATGTLLGGNLSVLTAMMGSEYLPNWGSSILFIEDVGEDIYRIDRMMTQLKLNGIFGQINGLIFGKCTECKVDDGYHFTLEQIIEDHIKPYKIPAFVGAQIGHIKDLITVPVGVEGQMDARKGTIRLLESPIK